MGILNVTPDSFSDGGKYLDPNAAVERALQLQEEGAGIIDIGAESTRPGSQRASEHDEVSRLIPVLKKLKGRLDVPVSVDTYRPAVAELAMQHGAEIINDISALTWEPELAKVSRDTGAGLVLSHMRGTPETWSRLAPMRDVMGEIGRELEAAVHRARRAGVELNQIVVDPGLGFGKRGEQNWEILARLRELERLKLPILAGPSRKSFLAQKDPDAAEFATAAAVTAAILNGAYIVRVHNVAAIKPAVNAADAVIDAIPEPVLEEKESRSGRERRVDFDLRPARDEAGPPRPVLRSAEPRPTRPAEDVKPPAQRPPKRDFQPRYGEGKSESREPRNVKRPGRDNRGRPPGRRGPNTPGPRG
jgi:dihydropteroate synthase